MILIIFLIIKTRFYTFFVNIMLIKVPAKSLLFGEYGVLYGGIGIVYTFWDFYFEVEFSFDYSIRNNIRIISDYFDSGYFDVNIFHLKNIKYNFTEECIVSSYNLYDSVIDGIFDFENVWNLSFIEKILLIYKHELLQLLSKIGIIININKYFDMKNGFGSSSAIIVSINKFFGLLFNKSASEIYKNLRLSVMLTQRYGSGYDVLCQYDQCMVEKNTNIDIFLKQKCFLENINEQDRKENCMLLFRNTKNYYLLSKIQVHGDFGLILGTNHYSNTSKNILSFKETQNKNSCYKDFIKCISEIADDAASNFSVEHLRFLIKESFNLQQKYGLTCRNLLKNVNFNYKYLGSGAGDSIWTLDERAYSLYLDGKFKKNANLPIFLTKIHIN